jgi:hypothetical protein
VVGDEVGGGEQAALGEDAGDAATTDLETDMSRCGVAGPVSPAYRSKTVRPPCTMTTASV